MTDPLFAPIAIGTLQLPNRIVMAPMGQGKASGGLRLEILVYGMNSLRTQGDQGGRLKWYIAASVPSVREGTKFFFTIITSKGDGAEEFLDRQADFVVRMQVSPGSFGKVFADKPLSIRVQKRV